MMKTLSIIFLTLIIPVTVTDNSEQAVIPQMSVTDASRVGGCSYLGADNHIIHLWNNENSKNVSYAELMRFIKEDETDKRVYNTSSFICGDYAETIQHNAESVGINAGWVCIEFTDGSSHACNVFNTTDKGIVYIDCTGNRNGNGKSWDGVVNICVNKVYQSRFLLGRYFERTAQMGTVKSIDVFW